MSVYRKNLGNGARLELDTDEYSKVLTAAGVGRLNAIASDAAKTAREQVRPSGKRFIGFKAAKRFQMQSTSIGQPVSPLAGLLNLPVALVTNNSRFAVEQEVGSLSRDAKAERPLTTVLNRYRRTRGVRSIREKTLNEGVKFGTASRASRRKRGRQ